MFKNENKKSLLLKNEDIDKCFSIIKILIDYGADINKINCWGDNILHTLIQQYKEEPSFLKMYVKLLELGAKDHIPNKVGKTAFALLSLEQQILLEQNFLKYDPEENDECTRFSEKLNNTAKDNRTVVYNFDKKLFFKTLKDKDNETLNQALKMYNEPLISLPEDPSTNEKSSENIESLSILGTVKQPMLLMD